MLKKSGGRLFAWIRVLTDRLGLSRLGVFTQVVVIIAVLCLAIVVEGVLGLRIIASMQKNTNTVFYNLMGTYANLTEVRKRLQEARNSYLWILNNQHGMPPSLFLANLRNDITGALDLREQKEKILTELSAAEDIATQSISAENYELFAKHLSSVEIALNEWEAQASRSNLEKFSKTKEYSTWASVITLLVLLLGGFIGVILGLMVVASIAEPLRTIARSVKSLATGDLSQDVPVGGCLETRVVAENLNQAIEGLRGLVRQIDERANLIFQASVELQSASSETGEGAGQVAKAMEELAKAAAEQTGYVTKTVETVQQLSALVQKVTDDTEELGQAAKKAAHLTQLGRKATQEITTGMQQIVVATQEFATIVTELGEASAQISQVTEMIAHIAEQTTLLALNAEIEAARAGEQGKGFEVIATETVKLSERSKGAALLIEEIATQMGDRLAQTVIATKEALRQVEAGQLLTVEAQGIFQEIFAELEKIEQQIDGVVAFARATATANEEVIEAMTTIAATTEEAMASTESVSAVAQEQSASTEQVASLADELHQVAERLKEAVGAFVLGDRS